MCVSNIGQVLTYIHTSGPAIFSGEKKMGHTFGIVVTLLSSFKKTVQRRIPPNYKYYACERGMYPNMADYINT